MKRRTFLTTLLGALGGNLLTPATQAKSARKILHQEYRLAGYQYHRASAVWPFLREGEALTLKREPHNPHDPSAIAVWFRNEKLGYVPRQENRVLAQMMDLGEEISAKISRLSDNTHTWKRVRFHVELNY
ncbi:MAG: HIRAN domain-containing protein [Sedimenticola sp.]